MRRTAGIVTILTTVLASCTIAHAGPKSVQKWGVAVSPAGSDAALYTTRGWVNGELLEVTADGVTIETGRKITFVHYSALRMLKPKDMSGTRIDRRAPSDSTIASWLPLVRFPAGITPEQLGVLLSLHGQSAPDVIQ